MDEKLQRLATTDPVAANLVKLRLFVGSNMTKSVAAVGIAVRSATDAWAKARARLHQQPGRE